MVTSAQAEKARVFRDLHREGILVLPNAWDAGSAAVIAAAGAQAIATTSGGVAWSLGRPDGGTGLTRREAAEHVRRIADAVDVPVSADIESGYGPSPADVADTVVAIIDAGGVGVNVEDSRAPGGPLFTSTEQSDRISAARKAADAAGLPDFVINVRTDVYLFGIGQPEDRFDDVVARGHAYSESGADSLFVPGLVDLAELTELVKAVPLPVNVMAGPGAPSVKDFSAVGVRRISLGTAIAQSAYATARRAAAQVLAEGTYTELTDAVDYGTLNSYFQ